jgi:hypothetical protein
MSPRAAATQAPLYKETTQITGQPAHHTQQPSQVKPAKSGIMIHQSDNNSATTGVAAAFLSDECLASKPTLLNTMAC